MGRPHPICLTAISSSQDLNAVQCNLPALTRVGQYIPEGAPFRYITASRRAAERLDYVLVVLYIIPEDGMRTLFCKTRSLREGRNSQRFRIAKPPPGSVEV